MSSIYRIFILLVIMGCFANLSVADVNPETRDAAVRAGAAAVTELGFEKGSATLQQSHQKELDQFVSEAKQKGEIAEIRVAAWGDLEYPPRETAKLPKAERTLAEKRADAVKDYLKKNLQIGDVTTLNMAERPNALQRALKTPTARTKRAMEKTGAAPTTKTETGILNLKGKASHVVVMVYYQ